MADLNDALEHPLADATSAATVPAHRRPTGHIRSTAGSRVCGAALCETVLSRYNDTGTCWVHSTANAGPMRRP